MNHWITVKQLYKKGVKIKEIARQLQISRNTVKSLLSKDEEPTYQRKSTDTKIDEFKNLIKDWYLEDGFIGTRIQEELNKLGYNGGINPIYRYLKTLSDKKNMISKKATVRIETPPGEQAQFDWSPYTMPINNVLKKVICFSMILSFSRKKSIVFSFLEDSIAIYEAIQELFEDLGGVTEELIIDNPKSLVIENLNGSEPKFNIDALRLATHLGVELNPCNCYFPRIKGKIEKPFQYIEEHFIKGNSFDSMTHLNKSGKEFINNWCEKVHGTTKRIPNEAHIEELNYLLPLPKRRFFKTQLDKRKVSLDSLIPIDGKKYSVPVKFVDKEVKYRIIYGHKIEIYDLNMNPIKSYEINTSDDIVNRDLDDYNPIANKVPKSIPEIKRQFKSSFKLGEIYLEMASRVLEQPTYHARQILKLKELYTCESLDKILEYCLKNNIFEIDKVKEAIKSKYMEIIIENSVDTTLDKINSLARDLNYYERGGRN